jgi:ribosomal protein L37AE/L43A
MNVMRNKHTCPKCNSAYTQLVRHLETQRRCLDCGELFIAPRFKCTCPDDSEGYCEEHGYWNATTQSVKRLKR